MLTPRRARIPRTICRRKFKKKISKKIWQQINARILSHILEVNAMFRDEKKERDFVNTYVINELFRIGMNQML